MKARELKNLGVPKGNAMQAAIQAVKTAATAGMKQLEMRAKIAAIIEVPSDFVDDETWGALATELFSLFEAQARYIGREVPAPWQQWGEGLEEGAVESSRWPTLASCR